MLDYDSLAHDYAEHRAVNPQVWRALHDALPNGVDFRVLEVGCGTGHYIGAIREATGAACWGVDPSAGMLATATQRFDDVAFVAGTAERLDYDDCFFDLIYSVDVIHHVDDHAAYFREAQRVLKMGGCICTVTDSAEDIRGRRPLSNYFPETIDVDRARYPDIDHLVERMKEAGFSQIQVKNVEFAYSLADIQPYRDKAFSCLHLIADERFAGDIQRLEQELRQGAIACVSCYTLLWGETYGRGRDRVEQSQLQ